MNQMPGDCPGGGWKVLELTGTLVAFSVPVPLRCWNPPKQCTAFTEMTSFILIY